MLKYVVLVLGLCLAAVVTPGCGGSSSGEKVVTYQGPAESAPQPKGMAKKGYGRKAGTSEGSSPATAGESE